MGTTAEIPEASSALPRIYRYVGPKHIAARSSPPGTVIQSPGDVLAWIQRSGQQADRAGQIVATFVVDEEGHLRLADRRSEHVACAGGGPVLAAGEMTFTLQRDGVTVEDVTNQSTGYCPEPQSWPAVASALRAAGIVARESGYTMAFLFRRCTPCGTINVIKEQVFECAVCGSELSPDWNFGT